MSWARVTAPLSGGQEDAEALAAGVAMAEPFGAELLGVYTPADVADVMPWMGDSFMGGVQATALESLKEAAATGSRRRDHLRQRLGRLRRQLPVRDCRPRLVPVADRPHPR